MRVFVSSTIIQPWNSEVMHSACVCILSFVLSISGILLVIVSSTLILICGNGEVMYSSFVCTFYHI